MEKKYEYLAKEYLGATELKTFRTLSDLLLELQGTQKAIKSSSNEKIGKTLMFSEPYPEAFSLTYSEARLGEGKRRITLKSYRVATLTQTLELELNPADSKDWVVRLDNAWKPHELASLLVKLSSKLTKALTDIAQEHAPKHVDRSPKLEVPRLNVTDD